MINRHEQEKKQFRRLFQRQGMDRFEDRFMVLEAFLALDHHVSAEDIRQKILTDRDHDLENSFVSSCMEHLCRLGFASRVAFDQGEEGLYEHRHLGVHHDHMVCTKCGSILEFKDEALEELQVKVAEAYGFYLLQHKMELYGLCDRCMKERDTLVPLHKAKTGERLTVKAVDAGRKMQLRISSMGLKIGDTVEVVSSGLGGQVVIAAGGNRLVLGKGMSDKILVQTPPLGEQTGHHRRHHFLHHDPASSVSGLPLSRMKAGEDGTIVKVAGSSTLRRRLLEMGINRGTRIHVEKYAPLKDPLELVVKGYHISLRVEEAANIFVDNITPRKK